MKASSAHFDSIPQWMHSTDNSDDIIISSRVRLARNFQNHTFVNAASDKELLELRSEILQSLQDINDKNRLLKGAQILLAEDCTPQERRNLVERHFLSQKHAEATTGRALIALPDASLSFLINEEDHLRLQCLLPGLQLNAAYSRVAQLDDLLEESSGGNFAFDARWGYLTACPSNVGTGIRASVMLHLPALDLTAQMDEVKSLAQDHHFTLRGTFGEGSGILGNLYQLSNQATLGEDESTILSEVKEIALRVAARERQTRKYLLESEDIEALDIVGRAYGVLNLSRKISYAEAAHHLSQLRLGVCLGWVEGLSHLQFNQLMYEICPTHLQSHGEIAQNNKDKNCDIARATMLRNTINKVQLRGLFCQSDAVEETLLTRLFKKKS